MEDEKYELVDLCSDNASLTDAMILKDFYNIENMLNELAEHIDEFGVEPYNGDNVYAILINTIPRYAEFAITRDANKEYSKDDLNNLHRLLYRDLDRLEMLWMTVHQTKFNYGRNEGGGLCFGVIHIIRDYIFDMMDIIESFIDEGNERDLLKYYCLYEFVLLTTNVFKELSIECRMVNI